MTYIAVQTDVLDTGQNNSQDNKPAYRKTFQLTCAVCCSFLMMGWAVVQMGTALPDLQNLVDIDLETASWLFTAWSVGYIIGSLISGVAYDRWNRLTYMAASTICFAVSTILLPWSPSFPLMLATRVAIGAFSGAIDTGVNTIVPSIWGNKAGPYMQALYLSYTVGGIISPLVTRPFMAVNISNNDVMVQENVEVITNVTAEGHEFSGFMNSSSVVISANDKEVRIHFAFIITGVMIALSATPYVIMFCLDGYDVKVDNKKANGDARSKPNISRCSHFFIIMFVCAVNVLYAAIEDSLGAFLVTFSLNHLHWDETDAVILSALYWSASCLGGLIAIFTIKHIGLLRMTFIAFAIWMVSFLGVLLCSQFEFYIVMWLFIPLSGMFMVVIIPNVISWTETNVCNVSGRVSSWIMMSVGTGIASNPPIIGYLMEKYSIIWLIYVLSAECFICLMCFTSAYIILNRCLATMER